MATKMTCTRFDVNVAADDDHYARLGEFHDLFMDASWTRLAPHIQAALGELGSDGVVVDFGAGTGLGTRVLAASTRAAIVALEPSLLMRSVLTARVADSPELSSRVTVVAGGIPAGLADVPSPIAGAICAHVLGGVTAPGRQSWYVWLSRHLAVDGHVVVTVQPERTGEGGRGDVIEIRRLGRTEYRAIHQPAPAGCTSSRYEVVQNGRVVRSETFTGPWDPLGLQELRSETRNHGFRVEELPDGLALIHRNRTPSKTRPLMRGRRRLA